jgi:hypothetical protein
MVAGPFAERSPSRPPPRGIAIMKNTECVIYITTKRGWTQTYLKDRDGWTQTGPNGIVRPMSAEQLLSHLLPPLAAGSDRLSVRVERRASLAPPDRT